MKEEFYNYLKNSYREYVQNNIEKYYSLYKSAYYADELCFWEFDNHVNVSDAYDYVVEYQKVYKYNQDFGSEYELPNLLYQTEDKTEASKLLDATSVGDYESRLNELMKVIEPGKVLALVDNEGYVKYN